MNNKQQFEAWYLENWGCTEDNHDSLFEESPHGGEYYRFGVRLAWQAWQAASKASEQQLAAVVAENAGLKSKGREVLNEACKVYEELNATISSDSGDFIDGQTLHEFQFVLDVETPATDAYLAEVRAAEAKSIYEGILDNPAVTDMESLVDWLEQHAKDSISFAAQLRQGEKS